MGTAHWAVVGQVWEGHLMPKGKSVKVPKGGSTAAARRNFYKRLMELGCVYCAECRCYQYPDHVCDSGAWMLPNVSTRVEPIELAEEETADAYTG